MKFNLPSLLTLLLASSVMAQELEIEKIHVPANCERRTKNGDTIRVHYVGTLENGKQFDSSRDRNDPLKFKLGAGNVIKGWEQGLLDMCVGETRKLTIPHTLAYGEGGYPPVIPPRATLIFHTELVEIVGYKKDEL